MSVGIRALWAAAHRHAESEREHQQQEQENEAHDEELSGHGAQLSTRTALGLLPKPPPHGGVYAIHPAGVTWATV